MLAIYEPVADGSKAYQTDHCGENPQDGAGSPACVLAAVVSMSSLNGTAEIDVALAKSSFAGGRIAVTARFKVPELQL